SRVEVCNGVDTTTSGHEICPGGGRVIAYGRDQANAGDGDSSTLSHEGVSGASSTRAPLMTRLPLRVSTFKVAVFAVCCVSRASISSRSPGGVKARNLTSVRPRSAQLPPTAGGGKRTAKAAASSRLECINSEPGKTGRRGK